MDGDAVADACVVFDGNLGADVDPFAEDTAGPNAGMGRDTAASSDGGAATDGNKGPDVDILVKLSVLRNHRSGMDAGPGRCGGEVMTQDGSKGNARPGHKNKRGLASFDGSLGDDDTGTGGPGLLLVPGPFTECDFVGAGGLQAVGTGNALSSADDLTLNKTGQIFQRCFFHAVSRIPGDSTVHLVVGVGEGQVTPVKGDYRGHRSFALRVFFWSREPFVFSGISAYCPHAACDHGLAFVSAFLLLLRCAPGGTGGRARGRGLQFQAGAAEAVRTFS